MGKPEYATFPSGCTATGESPGRSPQLPATPYPQAAVFLYELPVRTGSVDDAAQSLAI